MARDRIDRRRIAAEGRREPRPRRSSCETAAIDRPRRVMSALRDTGQGRRDTGWHDLAARSGRLATQIVRRLSYSRGAAPVVSAA
jgi:hypothetical protein